MECPNRQGATSQKWSSLAHGIHYEQQDGRPEVFYNGDSTHAQYNVAVELCSENAIEKTPTERQPSLMIRSVSQQNLIATVRSGRISRQVRRFIRCVTFGEKLEQLMSVGNVDLGPSVKSQQMSLKHHIGRNRCVDDGRKTVARFEMPRAFPCWAVGQSCLVYIDDHFCCS